MKKFVFLNRFGYFLVLCCFCLPFARCGTGPSKAELDKQEKDLALRMSKESPADSSVPDSVQQPSDCSSAQAAADERSDQTFLTRTLNAMLLPGDNVSGFGLCYFSLVHPFRSGHARPVPASVLFALLCGILAFIFSLRKGGYKEIKTLAVSLLGILALFVLYYFLIRIVRYGLGITILLWSLNLILSVVLRKKQDLSAG